MFERVEGIGDKNSKIAIFGLAPHPGGAGETGIPLTSNVSGEMLTNELERINLSRDSTYISNVIKVPTTEPEKEIVNFPELKDELDSLKAKVIVGLGKISCDTIKKIFDCKERFENNTLVYLDREHILLQKYHPSYYARNNEKFELHLLDVLNSYDFISSYVDNRGVLNLKFRKENFFQKIPLLGYYKNYYERSQNGNFTSIFKAKYNAKRFYCSDNIAFQREQRIFETKLKYIKQGYVDVETYYPSAPDKCSIISFMVDEIFYVFADGQKQREKIYSGIDIEQNDKGMWIRKNKEYKVKIYPIEAVSQFLKTIKMDLLAGWNVNFDRNLIIKNTDKRDTDINSIYFYDMLHFYKKIVRESRDSYKLNNIAKIELDEEKDEIDKNIMDQEYKYNPEKVIDYNIKDILLCRLLDKKIEILDNTNSMCEFINANHWFCEWNSRIYHRNLELYSGKEIMTPLAKHQEAEFEGGFVLTPTPGVYSNVLVFDMKSLYPSIIEQSNISLETVRTKDDGNTIKVPLCPLSETSFEDLKKFELKFRNDYFFTKEFIGIVPRMCKDMSEEREKIRKEMGKNVKTKANRTKYMRQYNIKVINNCFHPDTNVLVPGDIKNIKECYKGDFVYSINPITKNLEIKKILKTYTHNYNGYLYKFYSKEGLHLLLTEGHVVLVENRYTKKLRFLTAKELYIEARRSNKWKLLNHNSVLRDEGKKDKFFFIDILNAREKDKIICSIRKTNNDIKKELISRKINFIYDKQRKRYKFNYTDKFTMYDFKRLNIEISFKDRKCHYWENPIFYAEDFLSMLGWFISEGHMHEIRKKQFYIFIAQEKYKKEMIDLFSRYFRGTETKKGYRFVSKIFKYIIDKHIGNNSYVKQIPCWVYQYKGLSSLHTSLMLGDGNFKSGRYTTKSERLAIDFLNLTFLLGHRVTVKKDKNNTYRIKYNRNSRSYGCIRKDNVSKVKYKGKVYNMSVEDNEMIVAGLDGTFQHIKQSFYGVLGFPKDTYYDPRLSSSVTALGRAALQFSAKRLYDEHKIETIYSDTDSNFIVSEKDPTEVTNLINKYLVELGLLTGTNTFKLETKFEKKYVRFIIVSKKKYAGIRDDGEIDIKGFECVRSDHSNYSRKLQRDLIEDILANGKITIRYPKTFQEIRDIPLKDLAIPKKIDKSIEEYKSNPIHIRAIKTSGIEIEKGETVYYLNLVGGEVIAINEMSDEEIEKYKLRVDYDYIFENTIKHKITLLSDLFKKKSNGVFDFI